MSCAKFRSSINETAGTANAALQKHLDACESCRTFYAKEESLFAAIDAGLSRAANREPSASFLPRARAAISSEDVARQVNANKPWFAWWPAAPIAGVVCFALLLATRMYLSTPHEAAAVQVTPSIETPGDGLTLQQTTGRPESQSLRAVTRQVGRGWIPESGGLRNQSSGNSPQASTGSQRASGGFQNVEVIVPPDERNAFAHFLAGMQERPGVALALAHPAHELSVGEVVVEPPLEIAQLEVQPLTPVETEAK
jgi:hypothetical protein